MLLGFGFCYIVAQRRERVVEKVYDTEMGVLKNKLFESETLREVQRQALEERNCFIKETESAFKALSSEALQNNNRSFLDLAKNFISPIKESLEKFDQKVNTLEKSREGAYVSLTEQVKGLLVMQSKLEQETSNLVKALRAPNVRGQWGEMQLRRAVELAGMINQVDFQEQETVNTEDGRQRPDMIIHLPNGKKIIVDAKAPLAAYLDALETKQAQDQILKLKDHARQIKEHLQKLGSKNYWKQFEHTPEFVVLFLPGEMFFSAALEQDPTLIEFGVDNRVILATPTTLIALLKTISYGWKQESIALEAKEISKLGNILYERVYILAKHFLDIRRGLEQSTTAYNKAVLSLESRLLPAARKFKDLHNIGDSSIPEIQPIDTPLMESKAEELVETLSSD